MLAHSEKTPSPPVYVKKRLVLNGYYGFDNFGDELILLSLCRVLQRYGYALTVLSSNPPVTRQRYGVGAVHRYNALQVLVSLIRGHALISGGGGLLQDSTGPNSIIYYGWMMIASKILGLKVIHAFTSVGPIEGRFTKLFAGLALRFCDFVLVRDERSADVVEQLSGVRPMVAADAVWLLPQVEASRFKPPNPMRLKTGEQASVWKVAVSLRPHKRFDEAQQAALAWQMAEVLGRSLSTLQVELTLVSCEDEMDLAVLQRFKEGVQHHLSPAHRERLQIRYARQHEALQVLASVHWVVGMRYHALVAAILNETEVFALDYDPKVHMLARDLKLPYMRVDAINQHTADIFIRGLQHYRVPNLYPLKRDVETGFRALQVVLESELKSRRRKHYLQKEALNESIAPQDTMRLESVQETPPDASPPDEASRPPSPAASPEETPSSLETR